MWVAPPQAFTACEQVLRDPVVHRIPVRRYLEVMRRFHVHPSHSMVRVEAFRAAGEFIEGLKTADDVNLTLRMADVARGILYRPEPCVTMRLPDGRSFSLASSRFDQILAEHHAMLDVRSRGRSAAVRAAGRARQAWALRQLSREVAAHSHREAARLAWEAVVAYPTAGAGWFLVKSLLGGIIGP
jgi:hypothetical protein